MSNPQPHAQPSLRRSHDGATARIDLRRLASGSPHGAPRRASPSRGAMESPVATHTLHRMAVLVMALVLTGTIGIGLDMSARAEEGVSVPILIPATNGTACVEPIPIMRRHHMKFLAHQRDETVHIGIRDGRHSLIGCIDCHAAQDKAGRWIPIDAPGQFCASCHAYVSVTLDCFGCHTAQPTAAFIQEGDR